MDVDTSAPSQRLVLALHRATVLVDRVADRYLRSAIGISVSMFAALVTINAIGPARQSEVAHRLDVSRPAVTQRLVALVDRGLVEVTPDDTDQRANRVAITPAGRALVERAWRGLALSDDGLEQGVDIAGLQEQLERLIGNAERHLATPAPDPTSATAVGQASGHASPGPA